MAEQLSDNFHKEKLEVPHAIGDPEVKLDPGLTGDPSSKRRKRKPNSSIGRKKKRAVKSVGKTITKRGFRFTFWTLLAPPILISIVSIIHLYDLFSIGNRPSLAWIQAAGFEVLGISSIVAMRQMRVLSRFTRSAVWGVIILLTAYMMVGNTFSVFLNVDAGLLGDFSKLFGLNIDGRAERAVSIILGAVLPIMSLFFLKILSNFWYASQERVDDGSQN